MPSLVAVANVIAFGSRTSAAIASSNHLPKKENGFGSTADSFIGEELYSMRKFCNVFLSISLMLFYIYFSSIIFRSTFAE